MIRGSTSVPIKSSGLAPSPGELIQRLVSPMRASERIRGTTSAGEPATAKRSRKYSVSPNCSTSWGVLAGLHPVLRIVVFLMKTPDVVFETLRNIFPGEP